MVDGFEEFWGDFGVQMGPFGFGFYGPKKGVKYSRTENSHILQLKLDPDIKKEQIKVRLQKPGVLEIQWPRKTEGEEIPVE